MDANSPNKNKAATTTTTNSSNQTRPKTPIPRPYIRSYTCTFCEKGFSNAQALGGHMNIHRRDRARLRNLDDSDLHTRRCSSPTIITWQGDRPSDGQLDPRVQFLLFAGGEPRGETARGGPLGDGVDLELRLGLEPSSPSTSSSSPRKGI